jgi:hypothetical protein
MIISPKRVKQGMLLLLVFGFLISLPARAIETVEPRQFNPPNSGEVENSPAALHPKRLNDERDETNPLPDEVSVKVQEGPTPTFSSLILTPLIKQNAFDTRFNTLGGAFLVYFPIVLFSNQMDLGVELGPTFTVSNLNTGPNSFTHLYLSLPIRARLNVPLAPFLNVELFAGGQTRVFEDGSRTGAGFHFADNFWGNIDPDFGIGFTYLLSPNVRVRCFASYLYLAGGAEFNL